MTRTRLSASASDSHKRRKQLLTSVAPVTLHNRVPLFTEVPEAYCVQPSLHIGDQHRLQNYSNTNFSSGHTTTGIPNRLPDPEKSQSSIYAAFPNYICSVYGRSQKRIRSEVRGNEQDNYLFPEFILGCGCVLSSMGLIVYEDIIVECSAYARLHGFQDSEAPCPFCKQIGPRASIEIMGASGFGNSFADRIQEIACRRAQLMVQDEVTELHDEIDRLRVANVTLRDRVQELWNKQFLEPRRFYRYEPEEPTQIDCEIQLQEMGSFVVYGKQKTGINQQRKVSTGRFDLNGIDDEENDQPSQSPVLEIQALEPERDNHEDLTAYQQDPVHEQQELFRPIDHECTQKQEQADESSDENQQPGYEATDLASEHDLRQNSEPSSPNADLGAEQRADEFELVPSTNHSNSGLFFGDTSQDLELSQPPN